MKSYDKATLDDGITGSGMDSNALLETSTSSLDSLDSVESRGPSARIFDLDFEKYRLAGPSKSLSRRAIASLSKRLNSIRFETTLKSAVSIRGVGIHSGKQAKCVLHPAEEGTGISFVRSDCLKNLRSEASIKADISRVIRTDMSTTVGNGKTYVSTVEHLLAALRGMGIDNVVVEIDGPEIPILDGSATVFCEAVLAAGYVVQAKPRKSLRVLKTVQVSAGDKWVQLKPSTGFEIQSAIEFAHPVIGRQQFSYHSGVDFFGELSAARTFGFLKDVQALQERGLAKGGSLDNAVVLDDYRVLNAEGLRFADEFARHKVLDAIGDFALLGMPLLGAIELSKSGHELHVLAMKKLLEDPSNYEIVSDAVAAEAFVSQQEVATILY